MPQASSRESEVRVFDDFHLRHSNRCQLRGSCRDGALGPRNLSRRALVPSREHPQASPTLWLALVLLPSPQPIMTVLIG